MQLYNPFERLTFNDRTCFLSGEEALSGQKLTVFPEWVLDRFELHDKPFKLLDESIITYRDVKVPCSANTLLEITKLENEIQDAFTSGYQAVKALDEIKLFQWLAKMVYGMIYYETTVGIRQQAMAGERLSFSQSLLHKFGNFHLMLQSLIRPVEFDGTQPWTICIFPVKNEPQTFSYRDEINTLICSLRMNDFGIVACLQDNGANGRYHKDVLDKVGDKELSPIQFEEICGRFFYSAYLFNRLPEYTVLPTNETIFIEAMPLRGISNKPLFDHWIEKTYAKVLENFWKPWNISYFQILKNPERAMSFLDDVENTPPS